MHTLGFSPLIFPPRGYKVSIMMYNSVIVNYTTSQRQSHPWTKEINNCIIHSLTDSAHKKQYLRGQGQQAVHMPCTYAVNNRGLASTGTDRLCVVCKQLCVHVYICSYHTCVWCDLLYSEVRLVKTLLVKTLQYFDRYLGEGFPIALYPIVNFKTSTNTLETSIIHVHKDILIMM